jgi:hypothetical protein
MQRRTYIAMVLGLLFIMCITCTVSAQQPRPPAPPAVPTVPRPPVFFHEEWKKSTGSKLLSQEWITSPNLELKLYGPGSDGTDMEQALQIVNGKPFCGNCGEPKTFTFLFSGMTDGNWAVTLKDKNNFVDLRGPYTKIRWNSFQSGFHMLRPVIRTADGKYFVGDKADGMSTDWHDNEIAVADIRWLALDPAAVAELPWPGAGIGWQSPDLSKVDEVGFTDLSRGTGHGGGGTVRITWIEVVGYPVSRVAKTN